MTRAIPLSSAHVSKKASKKASTKEALTEEASTTTFAGWRLATPADDRAVVRFSQALFHEDPGGRPIVAADVRRTLAAFRAAPARGACVVAVDAADAVVGYAFLCGFWSNELGGTVCTLDELYIVPASRSQGRVSTLVAGLVERRWPFFADAVALELEVTPQNTRARALYDRLGFVSRKNATLRRVLARQSGRGRA